MESYEPNVRLRPRPVDQNLDTQLNVLTKAGCDRIFQDKTSGLSIQRPALDEILSQLREADTVLVARFFCLGHSRDHVIHLVHSFHERGIHFKALDLGIDTTTQAGKFMLAIFAALAEYDRESILEKNYLLLRIETLTLCYCLLDLAGLLLAGVVQLQPNRLIGACALICCSVWLAPTSSP